MMYQHNLTHYHTLVGSLTVDKSTNKRDEQHDKSHTDRHEGDVWPRVALDGFAICFGDGVLKKRARVLQDEQERQDERNKGKHPKRDCL